MDTTIIYILINVSSFWFQGSLSVLKKLREVKPTNSNRESGYSDRFHQITMINDALVLQCIMIIILIA